MSYLFKIAATVFFFICAVKGITQSYPDISGTWGIEGYPSATVQITQNGQYLIFTTANGTSNGYFATQNVLHATEWKTNANLSPDLASIQWDNQKWVRTQPASVYPDLSGTWYINGDANHVAQITQNGSDLVFSFSGGSSDGYFTATDQIFTTTWNTHASISQDKQSIIWNNQTWQRNKSGTSTPTGGGRFCRFELSSFYAASFGLGEVWARSATEPATPTAIAVTAMMATLQMAFDNYSMFSQCFQFDLTRITALRARIPSLASSAITVETETIIRDLQAAITNANFSCDNGVHPISLYVTGIHLGAAQAWASAQQCRPAPMPLAIQTVITNHLTTASTALTPYAACLNTVLVSTGALIPGFNFGSFAMVPVGSLNSIEPHTNIVGIHTALLWAIGMSDCCCNCGAQTTTTTGSACDVSCQDYCRQSGYNNGRYNGKTPCLLGVVSDPRSQGCDCY